MENIEISIPIDNSHINGTLNLFLNSTALVVFAHGSGSSRFSKRNQFVADILQTAGFSTLLFDLLTLQEEQIDQFTCQFRFDIPLLAQRLIEVTHWLKKNPHTQSINNIGYFGASTGAAAALIAAAQLPDDIKAVVSRGGRPDLAQHYLPQVKVPTLLIVGELDYEVINLNKQAFNQLLCTKELLIIPSATHLFEEPQTLQAASHAARDWFIRFLLKS